MIGKYQVILKKSLLLTSIMFPVLAKDRIGNEQQKYPIISSVIV